MTDDIDSIRAERDRLRTENQRYQDALVQHPFQNHRVTEAERVRAESEKSAKVKAAMQAGLEREAAVIAEREAALVAEGQERLATYREQVRQRFLKNGGTDTDFRSAWVDLKQAWLVEESKLDPKERKIEEAQARLRSDPRYAPL